MKRALIVALIACFTSGVNAQEKYVFAALDVNIPMSNTDWVKATSNKGLKLGYHAFLNEKFSAGFDFSTNTYEEYNPTETRQTGSGALTTDYFKYIYSYSAAINGQYNFKIGDRETFFPYVGLGLGANNNEYVLYYNIYHDAEQKWGFLARPEAGILVKISKRGSLGLIGALHYDYSTNKSEKFNYDKFTAMGFHIGLMMLDL
jgi:outer membrane protein W